MTQWNLPNLLNGLHDDIQRELENIRQRFGHPDAKGDAAESIWVKLLSTYLPQRYRVARGYVVDSHGAFSVQIDVVVFDRQYSPFIFHCDGLLVIPAESVYAVFEAKQEANAGNMRYAQDKVASVRRLHRTSLPIPHAGGVYPPKPAIHIRGGILTVDSGWKPALGDTLTQCLSIGSADGQLDLGCIASAGYFYREKPDQPHELVPGGKPATAFLFRLISQLQSSATVPMIDVQAYAKWLEA